MSFPNGKFAASEHFLRNYVSFFDQYAQVLTLFSPDSDAFVYCGSSPLAPGVDAVWVQDIDPNTPPRLVAQGCVFAAWSPQ